MKRWQIEKDGEINTAVGGTDIWSALGYTVTDLETPAIAATPKVLEAIDFIRHAAAQLSPSRVVEIEEAFRDHASKDLRYAWKEYDKAKSFTKEKVDEFLSAGVSASILTAQEKAAVLDNWPVS